MFEKIKDALGKFAKLGVADKKAVEELIRDIQRTLISADVDVKLVFQLSNSIKENALAEKLPPGLSRREHVIKTVHDELVQFLGKEKPSISLGKQKILLLGLFGSGKTTTTAKLGKYFKKKGLTVGLIGCDTWRPAAFEQLKTLADSIQVELYGDPKQKDPVKIVKAGMEKFKGKDVVIVDSAGRSALDDELRKEIEAITKAVQPDEKILILSGDIGQAAKKQAETFKEAVGLTGVIVTKLDSSAKGGGALSACHAAGVNVKFITTGEKMDDFELYDPTRFVGRLLGMGDLQSLLEKAQEVIQPQDAEELMKQEFTLDVFYQQIGMMKKMGSLSKIMDMLPMGGLKLPKEMIDEQAKKMDVWKIVMDSMTKKEKRDPESIDNSRISRIAKGAGVDEQEVRELLKSFRQMSKMMKQFKGGGGKMFRRGPMAGMFRNMQGGDGKAPSRQRR